jgi:hypothetical protein
MAISVSFNGATIYRPGSYSRTIIDLGGNLPLGPAGLVAIFGEADAGAPGDAEINIANNQFTAERLSSAKAKYRSGPIVDALQFLFSPAADGAIPNGAQNVWVFKTNSSVRSSKILASSYGTIRALEYGTGGNRITYKNALAGNGQAVSTGTPPALGAALDSLAVSFRVNGGSLITLTFSSTAADHDTLPEVTSLLNGLPAFAAELVASDDGTILTIKTKLNASKHQDGFGDCFEIVSGSALLGMTSTLKTSIVEPAATITISQKRDLLQESDTVGGNVALTIGRDATGGATSASVTVDLNNITLTDNIAAIPLLKSDYKTLKQLADAINLLSGWTASVASPLFNQDTPSVLDYMTVGAFSAAGVQPARIKKDAFEVVSLFGQSTVLELVSPATAGLPDALSEALLTGGAKGATLDSDIVDALAKFEKFHVNFVLPLFARDSADDIADNLTDGTSSYTIAAIHQAVKNHISLMRTTKKRSERQAVLAIKDTWMNCKIRAGEIAEGSIQLVCQDIRQVNAQGAIMWFQPWALAALVTGMRCGGTIGLPMTFKFANCSGIRQTGQAMTTAESNIVVDFDPDTQYEEAIIAGVTFLEAPTTGGYRIVLDNTTYGVDQNWVYNRASVIYAANIVAYNFRNTMESRYVGVKNTLKASEVKSTAESILTTFLTQGITVSTGTAPNGFKDLTVVMSGNTINISVTITLVEGIEFILSDITIQRATQSA